MPPRSRRGKRKEAVESSRRNLKAGADPRPKQPAATPSREEDPAEVDIDGGVDEDEEKDKPRDMDEKEKAGERRKARAPSSFRRIDQHSSTGCWSPSSGHRFQQKEAGDHCVRRATEQFAQAVHLAQGFADTLDAIPPSLTRSLSDLKELDAVLSGSLSRVHSKLDILLESLSRPDSMRPDQRLAILSSVVADIRRYRLGGEDKMRVVNGTCESLSHHIKQLDTTTSLLISSLPPFLEDRLPVPTFPYGYPRLSGALRSRPVGGVWNDSSSLNDAPAFRPPPALHREFIHFDPSEAPSGQLIPANSPFDGQPLHKRPRIANAHSNHHPSHLSRSEDGSTHTTKFTPLDGVPVLLDQHMMVLNQSNSKRRSHTREEPGQELKPSPLSRKSRSGASGGDPTLSEESKLLTAGSGANQDVGMVRNKRSRIPATLVETEEELKQQVLAPPPSSSQVRTQQCPAVRRRRVRKNAPCVAEKVIETDCQPIDNTLAQPPPSSNLPQSPIVTDPTGAVLPGVDNIGTAATVVVAAAAGNGRKSAATRQAGTAGPKPVHEAADRAALPTKRSYTKRNGASNGSNKVKKDGSKKAAAPPSVSVGGSLDDTKAEPIGSTSSPTTSRKSEGPPRGRKAIAKTDDLAEARHPKSRPKKSSGANASQETMKKRSGLSNAERISPDTQPHSIGVEAHEDVEGAEVQSPSGSQFAGQGKNLTTLTESELEDGAKLQGREQDPGGEEEEKERLENLSQGSNHTSSTKVYCICKGEVFSERMVACDNSDCPIEWFHYQCAGLDEDPTGSWFCSECRAKGFGQTAEPLSQANTSGPLMQQAVKLSAEAGPDNKEEVKPLEESVGELKNGAGEVEAPDRQSP